MERVGVMCWKESNSLFMGRELRMVVAYIEETQFLPSWVVFF
jgi:hypothetical protein